MNLTAAERVESFFRLNLSCTGEAVRETSQNISHLQPSNEHAGRGYGAPPWEESIYVCTLLLMNTSVEETAHISMHVINR